MGETGSCPSICVIDSQLRPVNAGGLIDYSLEDNVRQDVLAKMSNMSSPS